MLNHYSYSITREKAKELRIENEIKQYEDTSIGGLYSNYKVGWNKISAQATQYLCRERMDPKYLSNNEQIAYFLNDNGELRYGMYLVLLIVSLLKFKTILYCLLFLTASE